MVEDKDLQARALERRRQLLAQDEQLRKLAPDPEARARLSAPGMSSLQTFTLACQLYGDRPALGERATVVEGGAVRLLPEVRTLTYAQLWARVQAAAAGLQQAGLVAEGAFVGLCGFAGVDWVVADLACLYLAAVSVPLATAATATELRPIVKETALRAVVCSVEQLALVAEAIAGVPTVIGVVVMDLLEGDHAAAAAFTAAEQRIRKDRGGASIVWTLSEVERLGRDRGPVPPVEGVAPDALRTLVYTSGSTGAPKGAMFPERLWADLWRAPWPGELLDTSLVAVDYMPLNHMAGRGLLIRTLVLGGLTTFAARADLSTLFEDIQLSRPTTLFLVPRVASMIYQQYLALVARKKGSEESIRAEMGRSLLGDRLLAVQTGTAPTAPEVTAFIERCFGVPVFDGYGSTEANMIAMDGHIATENVTAYKLVDVPELGYRGSDRPFPRGELCVKVRRSVPGYYKNPAATAELFDDEGYVRTGDVVEQRAPGEIVWLDRRKNVIKLAQGEFVSVSRLEELFANGSPRIHQIYIYGSSVRSYVLAVIVPAGQADKATLAAELRRLAAREGLRGYEVPRDILVETEPFSRDNGLLTESNKPARARLRARYGERLEQLYEAIERRQVEDLYALGEEGSGERSIADKVRAAVALTLGTGEIDEAMAGQGFLALGGDSLGGTRLAQIIEDVTSVAIPVGQILDPSATVKSLARVVEARLADRSPKRVTFADVHGAGAQVVEARDLRLERFVPAAEIVGAEAPGGPPKVTLLTGANGFLGRFLLLELLERTPPGGHVVAIVRARDDMQAADRLKEAFTGSDPTLPARFAALSEGGRLSVLAGDLIAPRLGLPVARWDRLAEEVDLILHDGALVNHAFSYPQLFEPNVLGTVELIRLALRTGRARFGYVSTVGVASGLERDDAVREDEDAAHLVPRRPIDEGIAVGYGTSKWASEILLGDLAARAGVPVSIFRCSMLLPPSAYVGQVNTGDFLTRLLHDVVVTGMAPRSFYAASAQGRFDGVPVDFAARSIAAIARATEPGVSIFHVVAGKGSEGVSLDTMVDGVAQAGYPVKRIDDHAAWMRAFQERLAGLREGERQRSTLPILRQWERPIERSLAFDNARLRERLAALGEIVEAPRVDFLFVQQYLKNMIYRGIIGHPDLTAAA